MQLTEIYHKTEIVRNSKTMLFKKQIRIELQFFKAVGNFKT